MPDPSKIRNVAVVAHIDHGKTTLIDSIFQATQTFAEHAQVEERVMDSGDLEKERGITIKAKNCSVEWNDHLVNIVDTPGHADFSGEVERVLSMVDACLLLVDANEGPMPQTRYVLSRSLRLGQRPLVVLNKVDRPHADPSAALDATFDLFLELGATDEQADFPVLYGSGLAGWMADELEDPRDGMGPLLDAIIRHVPAPEVDRSAPFKMQVQSLSFSDYVGRIGSGRVAQGSLKKNEVFRQRATEAQGEGYEVVSDKTSRARHIWVTRGLDRVEVDEVGAGEIVWIAGPDEIGLGDTFSHPELEEDAFPPLDIEKPTVSMFFLVNSGPFSGREGDAVTVRRLRDRLEREARNDVALKVEDAPRADAVKVSGRGELHLAILVEEMRREGFEFCVSPPEVITREGEDGKVFEPVEHVVVEVPEEHQGTVIQRLAERKGELVHMATMGEGSVRLELRVPTRGLIGYRGELLTDTRGTGVMSSRVVDEAPWYGEIQPRLRGSMISMAEGEVTAHALENLQQRGVLFVRPGDPVYIGQVIGESARPGDMTCNPTKKKHVTNHRSATKDVDVVLKTPRDMSLDRSLEWMAPDELLEVTPAAVRLRKALLDFEDRKRAEKERAARSAG